MSDKQLIQRDVLYQHQDWLDGDFNLTSSDGWIFRVPSELLFNASEVLADAPVTGAQEFQFPDASIERKAVVEQFLSLASRGVLDTDKIPLIEGMCSPEIVDLLDNLRTFLHKYDCELLIDKLLTAVFGLLANVLWGWQAFVLGALWRNDKLCSDSLDVCAAPFGWGDRVRYLKVEHVNDCNLWKQVDPRYVFALRWLEFEAECQTEYRRSLYCTLSEALSNHDSPPQDYGLQRDGNVTLISADRYAFKVHWYTLLSAGFRMGLPKSRNEEAGVVQPDVDRPNEITFSDFRTERREVIEQFLSLAVDCKLCSTGDRGPQQEYQQLSDYDLNLCLDTIEFRRKYNCTATLSTFGAQILRLMAYRIITPQVGFGFGALIGDEDACAASLTYYHPSEGRFYGRDALPDFAAHNGEPLFLEALDHVEAYANGRAWFGGGMRWDYGPYSYLRGDDRDDWIGDTQSLQRERRYPPKNLPKCFLRYLSEDEYYCEEERWEALEAERYRLNRAPQREV